MIRIITGLKIIISAMITTGFLPVLLTIAAGLLLLGYIIWRFM